jgi:hypothetical protein
MANVVLAEKVRMTVASNVALGGLVESDSKRDIDEVEYNFISSGSGSVSPLGPSISAPLIPIEDHVTLQVQNLNSGLPNDLGAPVSRSGIRRVVVTKFEKPEHPFVEREANGG